MDRDLPLWSAPQPDRLIAWYKRAPVTVVEFSRHVAAVAAALPAAAAMINLCEDRYTFLVAYAAALQRSQTVLLPASRAEQVVADVAARHLNSFRCSDEDVQRALAAGTTAASSDVPRLSGQHVCMMGFTSGSTGEPKTFPKLWRSVQGSNRHNADAIRTELGIAADAPAWIVATVPPQHMYGMELTVLLPLIGNMAVHTERPLFPADIARVLAEVPSPRVLVSTPVHLRAMVESNLEFPRAEVIVSATAPLDVSLARAVEARLGGRMLEMFGSTETCVFARRRTAHEEVWQLYEGVQLTPQSDGTLVTAPWFAAPTLLQDVVELKGDRGFIVRGRNTDMIEVAGKRASVGDLTRRLLAIDGVRDAVVFQPDAESVATIRRVAALVVAPGLTAQDILTQLAPAVDPAFLPRPLRIVAELPRNELGKLPRERLVAALREG